MVVWSNKDTSKRLDALREKPKDEKTAIASGVAIAVVALLLIGWAIWFLHKITSEKPPVEQGPDFSYLRNQSGGSYSSDANVGQDAFLNTTDNSSNEPPINPDAGLGY